MSTFDTTMSQPDAPIWTTAIKWGAISGGVGIVLTMLFYNMGMMEPGNTSGSLISTLISLAIGLTIVYMGMKDYRENFNNSNLSFGRGMLWALGYGLVAGLIGAIFTFIFFNFMAPDFIANAMELQMAQMEEQGMGEEELEMAASYTSMFMSPIVFSIFGFLGQLFYALVQGLVASLVLKTR